MIMISMQCNSTASIRLFQLGQGLSAVTPFERLTFLNSDSDTLDHLFYFCIFYSIHQVLQLSFTKELSDLQKCNFIIN